MADLMALRRRILLSQEGHLPPGYREYDYIQCTGQSARFNTGVPGNDNTLVFDFTYMPLSKDDYSSHFGNCRDDGYGKKEKCWRIAQGNSTYPTAYIANINTRTEPLWFILTDSSMTSIVLNRVHFTVSYGKVSVSTDSGYSAEFTQSNSGSETVYAANLCIGSMGINISNYKPTDARFYGHFRIWSQGALIREYVPAVRLRDSKPGFYDLVNHTFNPSIGTAEFIAGNDT